MGREVSFAGSSNDIVEYVRFRQGTLDSDSGKSSLSLSDASDMIFDHISVEFGQWDDIDAVGANDITIQDSIIADPSGSSSARTSRPARSLMMSCTTTSSPVPRPRRRRTPTTR